MHVSRLSLSILIVGCAPGSIALSPTPTEPAEPAEVVAAGACLWAPESVDVSAALGQTARFPVEVRNWCAQDIWIQSVDLRDVDGGFALSPGAEGALVPGGGRAEIEVAFSPVAEIIHLADLEVIAGGELVRVELYGQQSDGARSGAAPTAAVAEKHQYIDVGAVADLDGSGSSDPEGDSLTWRWTFVYVPAGSALTSGDIVDDTSAVASFTADAAGKYRMRFVVGDGTSTDKVFSNVYAATAGNTAPSAYAGANDSLSLGDSYALDGSGSSDPEGDSLSYTWSFAALPAGSTLTDSEIVDNTSALASFAPDAEGEYNLRMVVSDGALTDKDFVKITAYAGANAAPLADAGANAWAETGSAATVDGTASSDADGDALSYAWSFAILPAGSALVDADIVDHGDGAASFTPDVDGDFDLRLIVSDGVETDKDFVWIYAETDGDGDGYTAGLGDCDDTDAAIGPGAPEAVGDGADDDCDGAVDETTAVVYVFDDLEVDDDPSGLGCADGHHGGFGCRGVYYDAAAGDSLALSVTSAAAARGDRALAADYQVSGGRSVGVIWEMMWGRYAPSDAAVGMEQLCLWLLDEAAATPYDAIVEFTDDDGNVSTSSTISIGDSWGEGCAELSDVEDDGVDLGALAKVALLLAADEVPDPSGTLYIDAVAWVDVDWPDFTRFERAGDHQLFLELLIARGVRAGLDLMDPDNGLARDRGSAEIYSTGALGFSLGAAAVAFERGWLSQAEAEALGALALDTMVDHASSLSVNGHAHHFITAASGAPAPAAGSEVSLADHALYLAGALALNEALSGALQPQIDALYGATDWSWFLNASGACEASDVDQFYLSWSPSFVSGTHEIYDASTGGYFSGAPDAGKCSDPHTWDTYTDEQSLIAVLAAHAPSGHAGSSVGLCTLWEVSRSPGAGALASRSWNGSIYTYTFADVFIDFSGLGDEGAAAVDCAGAAAPGIDHFANDAAAIDAVAADSAASDAVALQLLTRARSAGLGRDGSDTSHGAYYAWGSPSAAVDAGVTLDDGNAVPAAQAMAVWFGDADPSANQALAGLEALYTEHERAWGLYGPVEALNLGDSSGANSWFSNSFYGINITPAALLLASYDPANPSAIQANFQDATGFHSW